MDSFRHDLVQNNMPSVERPTLLKAVAQENRQIP